MRTWLRPLLLLALSIWSVAALEVKLDASDENRQRCAGMYSKSAWGGPVDPFIHVKFTGVGKDSGEDPVVSLLIFDWVDSDYIGVQPPDAGRKIGICEPQYVEAGYCNATDVGKFVLAANASEKSTSYILTDAVHLKTSAPVKYPIVKTGYYCVLTDKYSAPKYEAIVEFRNAYGELPATQIPKLPFYGGITILYALVLVFWGFLYFQHRSDILAVQNYITAILIFLVVEMLMTWGFYDYLNRNGSTVGSRVLLVTVAILNAARNSFSFFLLLIVCMGYGVVKPTLGRTMIYVRWLAIAHFTFGLIYAITSLLITPDTAGPYVLLIVLPLAGTLTAFYVWTLNSLNFTLKNLRERKQHNKAAMYKKLWWCILLSILVIFGFFFFNSFTFASATDPDYVPFHWKSRWFVLDGWLNLVYFADVAWVAYLWRPTANNRRFAMSDELAQEEDGTFEIANLDIGVPDDDSDDDSRPGSLNDEEARVGGRTPAQATSAARNVPQDEGVTRPSHGQQDYQPPSGPPLPSSQLRPKTKQQQARKSSPRRESMDGETIFAVGEDGDRESSSEEADSDSDDDSNESGEEAGLVKGASSQKK